MIGSDVKAAALEVVDGRLREMIMKMFVMWKSLINLGVNVDMVMIGVVVLVLVLLSVG